MRKSLWVSYAWADNQDNDIDFVAAKLDAAGVKTIFDRRVLIPGQRLWDQIGGYISDPSRVDAFSFIVTPNSLSSPACREELSYAIQRVMEQRTDDFPLIGLMHRVRPEQMPVSLRVRLCVPLTATNWVDLVVAGVNQQAPTYSPQSLSPYVVKRHVTISGECAIQINPRFEHVSPFQVVVDLDQKTTGNIQHVLTGGSRSIPGADGLIKEISFDKRSGASTLDDGTKVFYWQMDNEISPSQSCWLLCKHAPPRVWFGVPNQLALLHIP